MYNCTKEKCPDMSPAIYKEGHGLDQARLVTSSVPPRRKPFLCMYFVYSRTYV